MSALRRGRNVLDPGPWLWVLGALVLPAMVLVGFGPATSGLIRPHATATDVAVVITHDGLQMPDSVTAGSVTFKVTNRDTVAHGLAVRTAGSTQPLGSLDSPAGPGASADLQLTLDAGSYEVYCPEAGKAWTHGLTVVAKSNPSD